MSLRGPFALRFASHHWSGNFGVVARVAAIEPFLRRAGASEAVGVLLADGLAALVLLPGVLGRVAERAVLV